ncbi:hypothetical protein [Sphaerisporangium corydalis]|uniref:Uncharacterized protein n=1 Tax=Sphaerisporangium corydalis TaxID=1441875 RepID=A0ABV9EVF7_9ACTN|nr:hypothetical protein [Sphaerisporangium corydalis]
MAIERCDSCRGVLTASDPGRYTLLRARLIVAHGYCRCTVRLTDPDPDRFSETTADLARPVGTAADPDRLFDTAAGPGRSFDTATDRSFETAADRAFETGPVPIPGRTRPYDRPRGAGDSAPHGQDMAGLPGERVAEQARAAR